MPVPAPAQLLDNTAYPQVPSFMSIVLANVQQLTASGQYAVMFYNWDLINHTKAVRIVFPSPGSPLLYICAPDIWKIRYALALFLEGVPKHLQPCPWLMRIRIIKNVASSNLTV